MVAVSEEVVTETAMAVVKSIEVKRVRLLYADTSGQLRCRVCSPLFRVFTDLSYGYSREKVDRWRPLFVEKTSEIFNLVERLHFHAGCSNPKVRGGGGGAWSGYFSRDHG